MAYLSSWGWTFRVPFRLMNSPSEKTKTTLISVFSWQILRSFFLHIAPSLPVAEIHASRRFFALLDVASCAKLDKTSSMAL